MPMSSSRLPGAALNFPISPYMLRSLAQAEPAQPAVEREAQVAPRLRDVHVVNRERVVDPKEAEPPRVARQLYVCNLGFLPQAELVLAGADEREQRAVARIEWPRADRDATEGRGADQLRAGERRFVEVVAERVDLRRAGRARRERVTQGREEQRPPRRRVHAEHGALRGVEREQAADDRRGGAALSEDPRVLDRGRR